MNYSQQQLDWMHEQLASLTKRRSDLMGAYMLRQYRTDRSMEHSRHGFCRRLQTMAHCIQHVFMRLAPETDNVPEPEAVLDATVYLQAFVFHTFGSIDNLAHIWVLEKDVRQANGQALPRTKVGFGKKCTRVRHSLPEEFRQFLTGIRSWQDYLTEFRDALSHRVPLYIPPHFVAPDKVQEYKLIEARMHRLMDLPDYPDIPLLDEESSNPSVFFVPVTTHSFEDQAPFVFFHLQMLSDFNMIEDMAWRMSHALDE